MTGADDCDEHAPAPAPSEDEEFDEMPEMGHEGAAAQARESVRPFRGARDIPRKLRRGQRLLPSRGAQGE